MSHGYVWAGIAAIVVTATAGDVMQSHAMKQLGDLGDMRAARGLGYVVRHVASNGWFLLGLLFMAPGIFQPADHALLGPGERNRTRLGVAYLHRQCGGGTHLSQGAGRWPALAGSMFRRGRRGVSGEVATSD